MNIDAQQALILPLLMLGGLVYAMWFQRPRSAFGFLWLLWLSIGLGLPNEISVGSSALALPKMAWFIGWLPWNLWLLAALPARGIRSPVAWISIAWLSALIIAPIFLNMTSVDPAMQTLKLVGIDGTAHRDSFIQWGIVSASLAFVVRWVITGRFTELVLSIMSTIFLVGAVHPDLITLSLAATSALLFIAMLYNTHRMAFYDTLTGLKNRRSLDIAMQGLRGKYAIAMLDIDHFKKINDRFGHDFGDQVLRATAARLRRVPGFKPFRYGGEEFCMIFRGRMASRAEEICEMVREEISGRPLALRSAQRPARKPANKAKFREKVPGVKVTVSIGIAQVKPDRTHPEAVREAADKALYRAKKTGRDKVCVAK